jgi:hypothetical protein
VTRVVGKQVGKPENLYLCSPKAWHTKRTAVEEDGMRKRMTTRKKL